MLTTTPYNAYNPTYAYVCWDNFFTEEELTKMELYFDSHSLEEARVVDYKSKKEKNDLTRITSISMIQSKNENEWIFNKLLLLTDRINSQFYNYDLLGFDHLQYTVYDKEGSHYSYHTDMIFNDPPGRLEVPRKLSFSLILSERKDFEGGDFDFMLSEMGRETPEQQRGRIIAFPSFMMHRVTPVTKGVRKSLVFWACGPKFK